MLEVPVVWNDSEGTTVSYFSDSIRMFIDLIRIRLNDLRGRYEALGNDAGVEAHKSTSSARS